MGYTFSYSAIYAERRHHRDSFEITKDGYTLKVWKEGGFWLVNLVKEHRFLLHEFTANMEWNSNKGTYHKGFDSWVVENIADTANSRIELDKDNQ